MKQVLFVVFLWSSFSVIAQNSKLDETARLGSAKDVPGRSDNLWSIPFGVSKDSVAWILDKVKHTEYHVEDNQIVCPKANFGGKETMV